MGIFFGDDGESFFSGICGSTIFTIAIIMIFFFYGMKIVREMTGVSPFEAWYMTRKPPKWKDIEANVHPRLMDKLVREAKDSWDRRSKYLAIMSIDQAHYPTSERNTIRIGKVRGAGFFRDYHIVIIRTPWRFKKVAFLAPPDVLLSSPGDRTLVYEGTGVKVSGFTDIIYPSPSKFSNYTPQTMYDFVDETYNIELMGVDRVLTTAMAADLKKRATHPSAQVRREIELGKELSERGIRGDIEDPRRDDNVI